MILRKIFLGLSLSALSLSVLAQSAQTVKNLGAGIYRHPLGLNNFKNLPDNLLKQVSEHVSANGVPAKLQAQRLLQSGLKKNSLRKVKAEAPVSRASYTASDTLFWDSFEGWDGETMPWLPSSPNRWSTSSNIENLTPYLTNGSCPTWTGYQGDGYYVPYAQDGSQMLVCMYGGEAYDRDNVTVVAPAPQQDEWIVSPAITGIEDSHYLSFDICYSPWQSHYFIEGNDTVFDLSRTSYNVEVLITTNTRSLSYKAEDYTKVFDLTEEVDKQIAATNMNDSEAVGQLLYMNWKHVQLPLADFAGRNIRVALRYTGSKGGSIMVDAIRVSDLLPVAKYDIPSGSFYYGFSENAMLFTNIKMGLIPAYAPTVWENYSNVDSKSFAWKYMDAEGKEGNSTDFNLTMPALPSAELLEMPQLSASAGQRSDLYGNGYFKVGGNAHYVLQEGMVENFYVGNYDPTKQYWSGEIGAAGLGKAYAFGSGSGSFYAQLSNYTFNAVDGIGNFYETPASPYVFNTVLLPLGDFFNLGAKLACTIYKVENGNEITDEVIAQATVEDGIQISGGWYLVFQFNENIVVDDAIFVLIDGFSNDLLVDIAPLSQALNHDSDKSYAFVKLNATDGGFGILDVANLLAGLEGASNMNVSHCIGMNAVFPYLHSLDGDVFVVGNAGEEKSFQMDSYWAPSELTIASDASWVKAEPVVDEVNQTFNVRIVADALPAGLSGRHAEVKVSGTACDEVITVLQGDAITAINGVQAEVKSSLNGTFNLAGQRMNGSNVHGLYLVKKNGKYIKVLK